MEAEEEIGRLKIEEARVCIIGFGRMHCFYI